MKFRNYLLGFTLLVAWLSFPCQLKAFTPVEATVKNKGINVRGDAGTNSPVVSSLGAESKIQVYDQVTGADGYTWYMVYINRTTKGYVRGDLVTIQKQSSGTSTKTTTTSSTTDETDNNTDSNTDHDTTNQSSPQNTTTSNTETQNTTTQNGTGRVKGTGVRVRSLTSTSSSIVTTVNNNKKVTLLNKTTGADAKTWYQVSFKQNGKKVVGYIRGDLVKIVKDVNGQTSANPTTKEAEQSQSSDGTNGAVKGINVNVRLKPVNGTSVCKLSTNHSVKVLSQTTGSDNKDWYYIQFTYGNIAQEGYIRSDYVVVEKTIQAQENNEKNSDQDVQNTENTKKSAIMKGINVRIRKSAVNGTVICQQSTGFAMTVTSELTGSDGKVWYEVSFIYNENEHTGYVRSDFVEFVEASQVSADADFEAALSAEAFPESYKVLLRQLHLKQPTWVFKAVHTGLDWEKAVTEESKVGKNFVPKNSIVSYKSLEKTAYSYKENKWYTFDGGSWVAASKAVVAYYMDPRNFINDSGIYQFETLEYKDYQTKEGVSAMLSSTFMKGEFVEPDGSKLSYGEAFVQIGKTLGVNPYHLAARCYQEQGSGNSNSISGTVKGYENIFNYFHIGAYATGNNSPVMQGLIYASKTDAKYQRPWNTRYKSLLGGSGYLADKYIKVGQNTLYFQKFNVVNTKNGIYSHQYMTNLLAASSEAARMKKAYSSTEMAMEFLIPVYENMPEQSLAKPTANDNPNHYLSSLSIKEGKISPAFDADVTEYTLTVGKDVDKIQVSATPVAKTSAISGTGKVTLSKGTNTVSVVCRSASGEKRTYTIYVTRKE